MCPAPGLRAGIKERYEHYLGLAFFFFFFESWLYIPYIKLSILAISPGSAPAQRKRPPPPPPHPACRLALWCILFPAHQNTYGGAHPSLPHAPHAPARPHSFPLACLSGHLKLSMRARPVCGPLTRRGSRGHPAPKTWETWNVLLSSSSEIPT